MSDDQSHTQSVPTGFFSYRKLNDDSATGLNQWMVENEIPQRVPLNGLHCSVICSLTDVPGFTPDQRPLTLFPEMYRIQMMNAALVIAFESSALQKQYNRAKALGAILEYPSYQAHITVSYQVPTMFDISVLKPPPFQITLQPEIGRSREENWIPGHGL